MEQEPSQTWEHLTTAMSNFRHRPSMVDRVWVIDSLIERWRDTQVWFEHVIDYPAFRRKTGTDSKK